MQQKFSKKVHLIATYIFNDIEFYDLIQVIFFLKNHLI